MTSFVDVAECIYKYVDHLEVPTPQATDQMKADFAEHGYIVVKDLLSSEETGKLNTALESSKDIWDNCFELKGDCQKTFDRSQWKDPGKDILGIACGSSKTLGLCEQLLNEGDLYMYSGKVIMKKPRTGGSLVWHQDYGYWYMNGALFPHFITIAMALTQSDRHNGGIQIIKGSHKAGRIDHGKRSGQTSADYDRVKELQKHLSTEYADLAPGDAVIFHANIIHRSDPNESDNKRWNLIFRFDAHAIKECDSTEIDARPFLDPRSNTHINVDA